MIDHIGSQTFGNKYINSNNISPIELYYWNSGDTNKKIRKGYKGIKQKRSDAVLEVIKSWVKSLEGNVENQYSDF